MLQERFPDIRKVISTTGELLNISCQIPDELPDEWLGEFKKRQLVTKIGANHLIVRPYLSDGVRMELDSESEFSDKEKWQSQMEKLSLKDFSFSTLGIVMQSDKIFDLTAPIDEARDIPGDHIKVKKCPNCGHKLSEEELESGCCDECEENFWICPRCDALISDDPDDLENCPVCHKTLVVIDCPSCSENVFPDSEKCEKCGRELKVGKCPDCEKPLILAKDITECPYCETNIQYVGCPHCQKEFYIETD